MITMDEIRIEDRLNLDAKYYNTLNIQGFAQMMKDPSYCYKFYWLEAIVHLIAEDVHETTLDEVINEMIANAWYSVIEFHVHLSGIMSDGSIRDGLERAVSRLHVLSHLSSNASKTEIKNAIRQYNPFIKKEKEQLTNMVPYRALSGFFTNAQEKPNWNNLHRMIIYIEQMNQIAILPYTLGTGSKLNKEIYFNEVWMQMIQDNTVSILGWIQYEKIKWLQTNNPEVPGLVYKLAPLDEKMRKLSNVRKLWENILEEKEIIDVFNDEKIQKGKYDIDHFIPWSFVMNDELWNLMPVDSSLNASKSNHLPDWNSYFQRFANNQYILYEMIYQEDHIHHLYEKCYKDNLHSIWANQELYRKGNTKAEFVQILSKNMMPVYDSAHRQGYEIWSAGNI